MFSKLRAELGLERCEWYVIGAAPAPLEVLEFFAAIGIPICEVWGMSETLLDRDDRPAATTSGWGRSARRCRASR